MKVMTKLSINITTTICDFILMLMRHDVDKYDDRLKIIFHPLYAFFELIVNEIIYKAHTSRSV